MTNTQSLPEHRPPVSRLLLSISIFFLMAAAAAAQPMVDQVPSDAIVYVGWTSGQGLKEDYAGSHLKKLVDASNIKQTINEFFPEIVKRVTTLMPGDETFSMQLSRVLVILARHPTAIYFRGFDLDKSAEPLARIGLVCDAAEDAPALQKDLSSIIRAMQSRNIQLHSAEGRVTLQTTRPASQPATRPAQTIRFHKPFAEALGQVSSDPITILYIDTPRLLGSIDAALKHDSVKQAQSTWSTVVRVLGLREVRQAIWTGDFEGPNWDRRAFIGTSGPSTGLIALLQGRPLSSDELLKAVPQTASMVRARGFDLAGAFDELRSVLGEVEPGLQAKLDQLTGNIRAESSVDVRKDFLSSLGTDWVEYIDPNIGGANLLDTVYINGLHDPARAEATLGKLQTWFNGWVRRKLTGIKLQIQVKQAKLQGVTVHYLATPGLTPAWAIAHGRLYFSLYPEVTAAAVQATDGKSSILDNVAFAAMRTRLMPASGQAITSAAYTDLSQFVPCTYGSWLMLSRFSGVADLFGMNAPLQIIPPLATVMNELSPQASISWTDNAGLHWRSLGPFPGSELLMIDPASFYQQQGLLVASFILPSLNRAKTLANDVTSASNLRQIGQGIALYANDHNGNFPADLGEIWMTQHLGIRAFFRPDTAQTLPTGPMRNKAAMARWINAHSDYVYLGANLKMDESDRQRVVAYEKFMPGDEGVNILNGDGSVVWASLAELKQRLVRQSPTTRPSTREKAAQVEVPGSLSINPRVQRDMKARQAADSLRQTTRALRKYAEDHSTSLPHATTRPASTTRPSP